MKMTFGVIGGDRRQAYLADLLENDGNSVCTYGLTQWNSSREAPLSQVAQAAVILLPMPLCREAGILNLAGESVKAAELFSQFHPQQRILAGKIAPEQMLEAAQAGLHPVDYLHREELAIANAVPTAEGAIQISMEQTDGTLCGTDCLVMGFGRIGKLLAHRLSGLGARVSVSARSTEDRAWIRAFGWNALHSNQLSGQLSHFAVVFNTVPAPVLSAALLGELPEECLCLDLASVPGFDVAEAKKLGLQAIHAGGLPGKAAPRAAAAAVRDTVYHILEERGGSV
jgi:dipicolinate synthase subunit A